ACLEQTAQTASGKSSARERIEFSAKLIDRGLRNVSYSWSSQHLVTQLVDRRRSRRDQLGERAFSFGRELRREVADFVQLRGGFPKLGQCRLSGSAVRDGREYGSQGADGRVDLVGQVHPSNRQIRRGQTNGSGRGLG